MPIDWPAIKPHSRVSLIRWRRNFYRRSCLSQMQRNFTLISETPKYLLSGSHAQFSLQQIIYSTILAIRVFCSHAHSLSPTHSADNVTQLINTLNTAGKQRKHFVEIDIHRICGARDSFRSWWVDKNRSLSVFLFLYSLSSDRNLSAKSWATSDPVSYEQY